LATPGIYDTQRGFKLFTRKAANIIFPRLSVNRFGFDIELLVIAQTNNLKIKELPVEFDNPKGSKVSFYSYFATFFELLKIVIKKHLGKYSV
jgi:dolichyl-phosphate beta-glucosyltransferase